MHKNRTPKRIGPDIRKRVAAISGSLLNFAFLPFLVLVNLSDMISDHGIRETINYFRDRNAWIDGSGRIWMRPGDSKKRS